MFLVEVTQGRFGERAKQPLGYSNDTRFGVFKLEAGGRWMRSDEASVSVSSAISCSSSPSFFWSFRKIRGPFFLIIIPQKNSTPFSAYFAWSVVTAWSAGEATINGERFDIVARRERGKIPAAVSDRSSNAATRPKIRQKCSLSRRPSSQTPQFFVTFATFCKTSLSVSSAISCSSSVLLSCHFLNFVGLFSPVPNPP